MAEIAERVNQIRGGDRRAMATLMRDLDDERAGARDVLQALGVGDPVSPGARAGADIVVGVTGGPGAGKSTLVDALIALWRSQGQRIGVVAVDPSSPLAGGAVLGDRIRMQRHATDAGVFIRSVASRGASGGLSRSTLDVVTVLKAAGFSRVLVETVGVGQAEVDVVGAADVTLVVMTPGLGDDVQTLKAGILEIADVLVLNKADRPGADATVRDLQAMLGLRVASAVRAGAETGSNVAPMFTPAPALAPTDVSIIQTVATTGQGIGDVVAAVERVMSENGAAYQGHRRRRRAEFRIRALAAAHMDAAARVALAAGGPAATLVDDVASLRLDADAAAKVLMERLCEGY